MIFDLVNIRVRLRQHLSLLVAIFVMLMGISALTAGQYDLSKLIELARSRYGEDTAKKIQELQQLLNSNQSAPEPAKLKAINDFFNTRVEFVDDYYLWNQKDYWATPLESLGRAAGDCEDFAIAKYTFLKLSGISNDKLRLTYVRAKLINDESTQVQAHMVLTYYASPNAVPLVLDNLNPDILPASGRTDLTPIFSFNDKGLWVGNRPQPQSNSKDHLSKWRDVLLRIREDGIE